MNALPQARSAGPDDLSAMEFDGRPAMPEYVR